MSEQTHRKRSSRDPMKRQKAIITEYAKSKGYELEFFEGRAKSGKNTQRPEFEKMLKSLDRKRKAVVVPKIDRFARSLSGLLNTLECLDQKGVGFISFWQCFV